MATFGRILAWLGRVAWTLIRSRLFWIVAGVATAIHLFVNYQAPMTMIAFGLIVTYASLRNIKSKNALDRLILRIVALFVGLGLVAYGLAALGVMLHPPTPLLASSLDATKPITPEANSGVFIYNK